MGDQSQEAGRFSTALRGYDRAQVDRFVAELGDRLQALEEERQDLTRRLIEAGAAPSRDLRHEFEAVSQEVRRVLEQAWDAAEGIRERASQDSDQWRAEAEASADEQRSRARGDAEALRGDAWSAAEELLRQAQGEAERLRQQAEQDSLTTRAQAEREAHRLGATARRESEDELRAARMEAERMLVEARAQHDDIIETAHNEAQTAQERARALEGRRKELMEELETARGAIQRLEADLEARREALQTPSLEPDQQAGVRLLQPAQDRSEDWREGEETVRIVPAPPRVAPPEPVDADSMAAEVRRLRSLRRRPLPGEEPGPADEQAAEAEPPPEEVEEPRVDEVGALFAVLRRRGSPALVEEAPARQAETAKPAVTLRAVPGADPFDLRDRLLLPVQNRVLRSVKRQLTEEQNVILEELRIREGDWQPDPKVLEGRLHGDLVILVQESFAAGHAAAVQLTSGTFPRPRPEEVDLPDRSPEFAGDLIEGLGEAMAEGRASGQGPRELGTTVSRVFRTWRTDEAERRVQRTALHAYHRGLARTLAGAQGWAVRWEVAGRGCPDCRTAAETGRVPAGDASAGAIAFPPVHPGCGCTLMPVGET
ncbi:MAG: DivIVA domain-containing protein [Acidimicrobiia bacterium]